MYLVAHVTPISIHSPSQWPPTTMFLQKGAQLSCTTSVTTAGQQRAHCFSYQHSPASHQIHKENIPENKCKLGFFPMLHHLKAKLFSFHLTDGINSYGFCLLGSDNALIIHKTIPRQGIEKHFLENKNKKCFPFLQYNYSMREVITSPVSCSMSQIFPFSARFREVWEALIMQVTKKIVMSI